MPDQLGSAHEGVIDRPAQRLPAERRIHAVDAADPKVTVGGLQYHVCRPGRVGCIRAFGGSLGVMASRKREAYVNVCGLAEIAVRSKMSQCGQIVARPLL